MRKSLYTLFSERLATMLHVNIILVKDKLVCNGDGSSHLNIFTSASSLLEVMYKDYLLFCFL